MDKFKNWKVKTVPQNRLKEDWPAHMAGKTWVNLTDFETAYWFAMEYFNVK